jgi:beta-galactosidase
VPYNAKALFRWAAPTGLWHPSHPSVTSTSATSRDGRRVRFPHNWSWDAVEVALPTSAHDVLNGTSYAADQEISLGPWDVKVLREEP